MASIDASLRLDSDDAVTTVRLFPIFDDRWVVTIEAGENDFNISAPLDQLEVIADQIKAAVIAQRAKP